MGNRKTERESTRAHRRRLELILRLGGPRPTCARCSQRPMDPNKLQIDHVNGKTWIANKLSQAGRVRRYWREYEAGVPLRVLCEECNEQDGFRRARGLA